MNIKTKRVYESAEKSDGFRILVDRLYPRGIKKENLHADVWLKEVAPSAVLRKWFNHDKKKWSAFKARYAKELKLSKAFEELLALLKKHKTITLLYGAKDEKHNQAAALKTFLQKNNKHENTHQTK